VSAAQPRVNQDVLDGSDIVADQSTTQ